MLFGVADYVPALMEYVEHYETQLNLERNLVAVDGPARTLPSNGSAANVTRVEESFDMIHVVPPQVAPDFVADSPLAAASGFIDVE